MATVEQTPALITAEEFARRPDSGYVEELVRGRIIMSPPPGVRHGIVCNRIGKLLAIFVDDHDLGYVVNNDAGVVTERGPDTVRGPDVSYYSYARLPKGDPPTGYNPSPPELVFEVLSPSDRWGDVLRKVGEYINAGVLVVVVLDPEERNARLFDAAKSSKSFGSDEVLRFESILPGFDVTVGRLFE
ncbi:Uma2 family endonuclease [Paludisphaera mucosa]|uniref:Uma2 family endonuclease n=1 Tax=Paludisphaera mucosa TaxID=3030827 RepID=A0ABT6FCP2_9BACT|nr:Uma2 family endonuclease [Paludisphaera mucosa]MDG3005209.1 Uma2 family endonuclease [Paludisphaera mucosa]